MAGTFETWSARVEPEEKEKLNKLIEESGLSVKDFLSDMISIYELKKTKENVPVLSEDIDELQKLTLRINSIYSNLGERIQTLLDSKDKEFEKNFKEKEEYASTLFIENRNLKEEKEQEHREKLILQDKNQELEKQLADEKEARKNSQDLIEERKDYKEIREENKKLKEENQKLIIENKELELDKEKIDTQLKDTYQKHDTAIAKLKEEMELKIEKEKLKLEKASQKKLEEKQDQYDKKINELNQKIQELLEKLEKKK